VDALGTRARLFSFFFFKVISEHGVDQIKETNSEPATFRNRA
jgi:hypothetical protein